MRDILDELEKIKKYIEIYNINESESLQTLHKISSWQATISNFAPLGFSSSRRPVVMMTSGHLPWT